MKSFLLFLPIVASNWDDISEDDKITTFGSSQLHTGNLKWCSQSQSHCRSEPLPDQSAVLLQGTKNTLDLGHEYKDG
jgi:hypothetical protein